MTALTAYLTSTNDGLVAGARQLTNAAPSSETSVTATGQLAQNGTGWIELFSRGAGGTTLAGSEPAVSGHGFIWDATSLEGQYLTLGNWTPTIKLGTPGLGSFVLDIHVRIFKRSSGGVFTQFTQSGVATDLVLTGQTVNSTATAYVFSAASLDAMSFVVGDKLYLDVVVNITTGNSNPTAGNRQVKLFENGGANDAVVTSGYLQFLTGTATDTTNTSDSVLRGITWSRAVADTSASSDAATRRLTTATTTIDTSVSSDTAIRSALPLTRTAIDSTTSSDLVTSVLTFNRNSHDTSALSDSAQRSSLPFARTGSDISTSDDSAIPSLVIFSTAGDTSTSNDLAIESLATQGVASDSSNCSDSTTSGSIVSRIGTDSSIMIDTNSRVEYLSRTAMDTSLSVDVGVRIFGFARLTADTSLTVDVSQSNTLSARQGSDQSLTSDIADHIWTGNRILSDFSTSIDSARGVVHTHIQASDTSLTIDQALRGLLLQRFGIDTSITDDHVLYGSRWVRLATDISATSDLAVIVFVPESHFLKRRISMRPVMTYTRVGAMDDTIVIALELSNPIVSIRSAPALSILIPQTSYKITEVPSDQIVIAEGGVTLGASTSETLGVTKTVTKMKLAWG